MANGKTSLVALKVYEPAPEYKVCLMDDGTIRILGDTNSMSRSAALKIAYALMSAGAQT